MVGFRSRKRETGPLDVHDSDSSATQIESQHTAGHSKSTIKQATKTRRNAIIFACICYALTIIFLIVVQIGNTPGSGVRQNIYFLKLDLSNIVAQSLPQSLVLTNSIARTLGLHDFYQVGLWNFCEGYNNEGITYCSDPKAMYWFNPVEIILSELFYGASIALPSQVNSILSILQLASHVMFGCFLAAACLAFVLIPVSFIVIKSRLWSGVVSVFALINTLLIIVGSAVGTAMGIIAQYALSSQPELNVKCDLGITMYVLMWIAAAFSLLAFFVHASMCCCCMSRRDLTSGRRNLKTSRKAGGDNRVANDYGESTGANNDGVVEEKKKHGYSLPKFHKMHRRPSARG